MALLPSPDCTDTPPRFSLIRRLARYDGCPECVQNYELPYYVADDELGEGFVAHYGCGLCGHSWRTGWQDES